MNRVIASADITVPPDGTKPPSISNGIGLNAPSTRL
jgi:hypothetical protein